VLRTICIAALLTLAAPATAHQDQYPMAAAAYKQRSEQRFTRYKERLEQHIIAQKLDAPTRDAVRTRFAALEVELRMLVDKLSKDKVITLAEANEVKQLARTGRDAIYRDFKIAPDEKKPKKR
jgi:hypothetical protein